MGLLGSMTVRFVGDVAPLTRSIGVAKSEIGGFGNVAHAALGGAVNVLLDLTKGVLDFGGASIKMSADYQQAMNKVQALTGASNAEMSKYDAGLKSLAVDAGVSPKLLADGLYNVLSASYKGADAMKVLTLATQDSKIGMTSATVTTDALTNILRTFGVQSKDITRVNGEMLATVTLGKATFEQYATTIVKAGSASKQFGISMETMNAAWATMTSSGIRAAQASTDYQQMLKVMEGNIGTVTKALQKNGIAFDETKFNAMSFGNKVVYLNSALEKANAEHVKITGVTIQAAQGIKAISDHVGNYNANLATLSNKQAMAQKTAEAWAITQGGFNQTMSRAKAAIDVLMISVGNKLLPILTKLVSGVIPIIKSISDWVQASSSLQTNTKGLSDFLDYFKGLIIQVGDQVKPLIVNFIQWNNKTNFLQKAVGFLAEYIKALGATLAWAIPLVVGIVIEIVKFAYSIYQSIKPQLDKFAVFWKQHWTQIHAVLLGVWEAIQGVVLYAWSVVKGIVLIGLDILSGNWSKLWTDMLDMLGGMWKGVLMIVGGGLQAILNSVVMWADPLFSNFVKPFYDAYNAVAKLMGQPIAVAPTLSHLVGTVDILGSMSGSAGHITDILAQQRAAAAARHDFYANKNSSLSTGSNPFATPKIPTTNPMSTNYPTSTGTGGGSGGGGGHHTHHHTGPSVHHHTGPSVHHHKGQSASVGGGTGSSSSGGGTGSSSSGRGTTLILEINGHEFARVVIDDIMALMDKKTRLKVSRGRAA